MTTATSRALAIPEVFDTIIESIREPILSYSHGATFRIRGAYGTLAGMVLVCKAWRAIVTPSLYYALLPGFTHSVDTRKLLARTLLQHQDLASLVQHFDFPTDVPTYEIACLLQLLPNVTSLSAVYDPYDDYDDPLPAILYACPSLPRIERLCIGNLDDTEASKAAVKHLLQRAVSLQFLGIYSRSWNRAYFQQSVLPSVTTLSLGMNPYPTSAAAWQEIWRCFPKIKHLKLEGTDNEDILCLLPGQLVELSVIVVSVPFAYNVIAKLSDLKWLPLLASPPEIIIYPVPEPIDHNPVTDAILNKDRLKALLVSAEEAMMQRGFSRRDIEALLAVGRSMEDHLRL